nr:MAG TPA: hypothetical protein [Caudoviricetes sp.]
MAGFSLRASMSNRSFNYEDIDSEGVVLDGPVEDVVEQLETTEAEESNAVEVAALDTAITEGENADVVADDIEETIADGEAVIEAADEEAATSGDEPAIAPEDVAVMQEKVRTFLKFVPGDGITFALSRESVRDDGYNAFKMNLEGLKEMGEKVKQFLKDVWKKIVDGFDKVVNFIKKFLPTKLNRLRWLLNELNKTDLSKSLKEGKNYEKAEDSFKKGTLKNFRGAAKLLGVNLESAATYASSCVEHIDHVVNVIKKGLDVRDKDDKKKFMDTLITEITNKPGGIGKLIDGVKGSMLAKEAAREQLSDTVVKGASFINIRPSGNDLIFTISADITKDSRTDDDDDRAYNVLQIIETRQAVTEEEIKKTALKFDIKETKNKISDIVKNADQFTAKADKLNKAIKDFRKDVVDSGSGNMFTNWWGGRQAEKALRRMITGEIGAINKYQGDILSYAIAYGRAVLTAYNANKQTKEPKDNK